MKEYDFIFGVFNKDGLVLKIKQIKCSHFIASILVGILDLAKDCLNNGDYFACDYHSSVKQYLKP